MGHNRAGVRKRKKLSRSFKNEDRRLNKWAKREDARLKARRDHIWLFSSGGKQYFSPTEPSEENKVKIDLPKPMTFWEAMRCQDALDPNDIDWNLKFAKEDISDEPGFLL